MVGVGQPISRDVGAECLPAGLSLMRRLCGRAFVPTSRGDQGRALALGQQPRASLHDPFELGVSIDELLGVFAGHRDSEFVLEHCGIGHRLGRAAGRRLRGGCGDRSPHREGEEEGERSVTYCVTPARKRAREARGGKLKLKVER